MNRLLRVKSLITGILFLSTLFCSNMVSEASYDGVNNKKCLAICSDYTTGSITIDQWKINNVNGVERTFLSHNISTTKYIDTTGLNQTIEQKINETFSGADDDDINYLYMTGHGDTGLINIGEDMYYSDIKSITDQIPGRFVIFFQCCHSGSAIDSDLRNNAKSFEEQICDSFFSEESQEEDRSFAGYPKYTIFCACESDELAYHSWWSPNNSYSYATEAWMLAMGYEIESSWPNDSPADINFDGIITAKEIQDYTEDYFIECNLYNEHDSHPCYYSMYYFETVYTDDYLLGDVNEDGAIAMADILMTMRYINGVGNLSSRQIQLADVSGDGYITETDKLYIQKYVAHQAI